VVSVTYYHDGHPAFRTGHRLAKGELVLASFVEWPSVRTGEETRCGTCGYPFSHRELNDRYLAPVEDEISA